MANETLLLRKGLLANLESAPKIEGALSFTIDEPAIYIDVKNDNGVVEHLRIGDIKEYDSLDKLKEFLGTTPIEKVPTTGLYYAIKENALMKCAIKEEEDGTRTRYWQQINVNYSGDISALQAQITAINTAMGDKPKGDGWSDASIWAAIAKNRSDIAAEVIRATDAEATLDDKINTVRTDLGYKTDAADANGSAFARIAKVKIDLGTINDTKDDITAFGYIAKEAKRATDAEAALDAKIGSLNAGEKPDGIDESSIWAAIGKNRELIEDIDDEIGEKDSSISEATLWSAIKANKDTIGAKNDAATANTVYGYIKTEVERLEEVDQAFNTKIGDKDSAIIETSIWDAIKNNRSSISTNLETATKHSDANLEKAKAHSDANLEKAKTHASELVNALSGTVTALDTTLSKKITALENVDTTINGEITTIKGNITTINNTLANKAESSAVEAIDDKVDGALGRISANEGAITAINEDIGEINEAIEGIEGTLVGIGEEETVVGLINAASSAASLAAAAAEANAKTYAATEIGKEKTARETAITGVQESIGNLRTEMNSLIGTVPEGSNVIKYVDDSQVT